MLSFLYNGSKESSANKMSAECNGDDCQEQPKYFTAVNKSSDKSTVILIALLCIGVVSLVFMIKKVTPRTASAIIVDADNARIEDAIIKIGGVKTEMFESMDKIVAKFYQFSDVKQVQSEELFKNPFRHEPFLDDFLKAVPGISEIDTSSGMVHDAGNMQLMTIMKTENGNCCMIDDVVLYEGDFVGDFSVIQISNDSVLLKSDATQITLKLEE